MLVVGVSGAEIECERVRVQDLKFTISNSTGSIIKLLHPPTLKRSNLKTRSDLHTSNVNRSFARVSAFVIHIQLDEGVDGLLDE